MDNLWNHAYKAALAMEPIALIGTFVKIRSFGTKRWRRVMDLESIAPFQFLNMGAIAALGTTANVNAGNLDLYDEEFGQWRWFPLDNCQVSCFNPAAVPKWQLKNMQVAIDRSIIYRDPLLLSTEICTWEDERPAFRAINFSPNIALGASRLIGLGFRFLVEEVSAGEKKKLEDGSQAYTNIPCSAAGTGELRKSAE